MYMGAVERTTRASLLAGADVRHAVRERRFTGSTAGVAPGFVQGNVAILPQAYAREFLRYCTVNPKPLPVIAVSAPGVPFLPTLGHGLDIRTDVPGYLVFEHGVQVAEIPDLTSLWREDLVTFVLGCSFSFDQALLDAGVTVRHVLGRSNAAMWRTNIATVPVGPFHGPTVVSMRPISPDNLERAILTTKSFAGAHGAPLHWGDARAIGIADISKPDYGDPVPLVSDELPVFWACGVTAQVALKVASLPLAITHKPGCMLVTDLLVTALASR
jgi:uncharacterized protein YcsI (UPF0317 family)